MVHSIDGSTVVDGLSAKLSSPTDTAVLGRLRSLADVIIVGAGTVREESYGPPRKAGQRIGVVTASGDIDTTAPLFTSGAGFVITTESTPVPGGVPTLRCGTTSVDLATAIERLETVAPATRFVQAEGGAVLNGSLMAADVVDEIDVTTSPLVVGGAGPRLTAAAPDLGRRYELVQMAVDDGSFVFSRWIRRR